MQQLSQHRIGTLVHTLAAPFLIHLPAKVPGKAVKDGPYYLNACCHRGDQDTFLVPSLSLAQLQPQLVPAIMAICVSSSL